MPYKSIKIRLRIQSESELNSEKYTQMSHLQQVPDFRNKTYSYGKSTFNYWNTSYRQLLHLRWWQESQVLESDKVRLMIGWGKRLRLIRFIWARSLDRTGLDPIFIPQHSHMPRYFSSLLCIAQVHEVHTLQYCWLVYNNVCKMQMQREFTEEKEHWQRAGQWVGPSVVGVFIGRVVRCSIQPCGIVYTKLQNLRPLI